MFINTVHCLCICHRFIRCWHSSGKIIGTISIRRSFSTRWLTSRLMVMFWYFLVNIITFHTYIIISVSLNIRLMYIIITFIIIIIIGDFNVHIIIIITFFDVIIIIIITLLIMIVIIIIIIIIIIIDDIIIIINFIFTISDFMLYYAFTTKQFQQCYWISEYRVR